MKTWRTAILPNCAFQYITYRDQGSATHSEDAIAISFPYFAVIDGTSNVYTPENGPKFIGTHTLGQIPGHVAQDNLGKFSPSLSLEQIIDSLNHDIGEIWEQARLPVDIPSEIGNASFLFGKIDTSAKEVHLIQGGDCFVVWILKNGETGALAYPPLSLQIEEDRIRRVAEIMREVGGDREEMWRLYAPYLKHSRDENGPKEAGLNGQSHTFQHRKVVLPLHEIGYLLLFTDGLVPLKAAISPEVLTNWLCPIWLQNQGDIEALKKATWEREEQEKALIHIEHQEFAFLGLKF